MLEWHPRPLNIFVHCSENNLDFSYPCLEWSALTQLTFRPWFYLWQSQVTAFLQLPVFCSNQASLFPSHFSNFISATATDRRNGSRPVKTISFLQHLLYTIKYIQPKFYLFVGTGHLLLMRERLQRISRIFRERWFPLLVLTVLAIVGLWRLFDC